MLRYSDSRGGNILKIAICDDNTAELDFIYELLKEYYADNTDYPLSVHTFSSAIYLIDYIKKDTVDLYFLDILMPGINGIELGQYIREKDADVPIVYITITPDFAVQSYSVQATDYILKPFDKSTFFGLMERLNKRFQEKFYKRWSIKTKTGLHLVTYHEIMYIEYQEHRLNCYQSNGEMVKSNTLRISFDDAAQEILKDSRFLKISASFIINMNFVSKVSSKEFIMKDSKSLTITRQYKNSRKTYIDFLLNGET